ncbi:MAG: asparagine--tRNA ligase [Buchnera aphidicola (Periphyllus acericola)]|uniref:asparagine--tRNA ligase n=1 Tax=Buchnera aphidicola TaxID=9 RepID=UPI0030D20D98|nr:asparagine--tRNA ligase [Buchnera aphidicola (Periphyllus acericola)]
MKVLSIKEILTNKIKLNSIVKIKGWVKNRRSSKSTLFFIDIYDGSCINSLQLVFNESNVNCQNLFSKITAGCSLSVEGKLNSSFRIKNNFEIQVLKYKIIGNIIDSNKYPMSIKKHTMEHLRKYAHLRPRTNIIGSISRIRTSVFYAFHRFFYKNNYYWVPSPILTSLNAEGAGEMFKISNVKISNNKLINKKKFFGKNIFLTVSGQLTIEAYACSLSKVYTFGPIFRAENSNTTRHLSEFWMLEVELAFADIHKIITVIIKLLKYVIKFVLENNKEDLLFFKKKINSNIINRLKNFLKSDIIKISYKSVIEILKNKQKYFKNKIFYGMELISDHEKFLVDKYFKAPIIIINYPKEFKPFYMRVNKDKKTVSALDFLFPGVGEIIGGSQREERIKYLDKRINELKLNMNEYQWYRDLRKYGTVPHSGFGLGLERFIMFITGVKNIKDVIPFPRTINNANF